MQHFVPFNREKISLFFTTKWRSSKILLLISPMLHHFLLVQLQKCLPSTLTSSKIGGGGVRGVCKKSVILLKKILFKMVCRIILWSAKNQSGFYDLRIKRKCLVLIYNNAIVALHLCNFSATWVYVV